MKHTYQEYQTVYYLHELLPVLEQWRECKENLCRINLMKPGGLFLHKAVKETKKEALVCAMAEMSTQYLKQKRSFQEYNVVYLEKLFQLKPEEVRILKFLVAVLNNDLLRRTLGWFSHDLIEKEEVLEVIAGLPCGAGCSVLKESAPPIKLGFLSHLRFNSGYQLTGWSKEFINTVHQDDNARYKALMGLPLEQNNEFTRKDFSYVEAATLALRLIKQAKHTKGFNILLYGVPGTGKTSFAKLLAKTAKLNLYPVGVCNGGEDEKNYRLQQYYRKQFLLKNVKNACLLFDEGEDMFSSLETRTSKMEINNLLENNEVPVIWTTNKIHRMDPAFIRRFTLAVCFGKPPVEVREKIWSKYLMENKIVCKKGDTLVLAKKYEVPPSMIAGATSAARMAKGNLDTVKEHLSFMTQALNGGYKKPEEAKNNQKFCPALIHADMDLNSLTTQLKELGRLNFSLCLYGASGTGKSAYARHLAEELELDVTHRRASDLLSKWVGGTEQNIAEAFAQAKENKSLLIFDEADSFLRDRTTASHSWEISGVNEMLTWMENHPYPFICTTNLMDTLDPASLRRFSFKVKYDFLTSEQVKEAFSYFFGLKITPRQAAGLDKLTPGDFALVKNKAEILGKSTQFDAVREMLETEQKLKRNAYGSGIGFRVN